MGPFFNLRNEIKAPIFFQNGTSLSVTPKAPPRDHFQKLLFNLDALFLFYKEPTSSTGDRGSLYFLLFSIVTETDRTKESIVFSRNPGSKFLVNYLQK